MLSARTSILSEVPLASNSGSVRLSAAHYQSDMVLWSMIGSYLTRVTLNLKHRCAANLKMLYTSPFYII